MIDPNVIIKLVSYDKETGDMTWAKRKISFFKSERSMRTWNTKYSGMRTMNTVHNQGYLCGKILGKSLLAHRVAWVIAYGDWPKGEIDHINGDRTDNRIKNLRDVGREDNARNCAMRRDNTSGHVGVHFNKRHGTWAATVGGKHIGSYSTKEDAIAARSESQIDYTDRHGKPDLDSIKMEEV